MSQTNYSINRHPISIVLAWIEQGEIAIPEIQRPSACHQTQVWRNNGPKIIALSTNQDRTHQ